MPTKAPNWSELHSRFEMKRINGLDGACTNWAEEFFSRMRRAEIGHHHHLAGAYLLSYAQKLRGARIIAVCPTAAKSTESQRWQ